MRAPTPPGGRCRPGPVSLDPAVTNRDHYQVVVENDRVRVLEYTDQPGDVTTPHEHHSGHIRVSPTHVVLVKLEERVAGHRARPRPHVSERSADIMRP